LDSPSLATVELPFACPACRGTLTTDGERYACSTCRRSYPVVCGIPDFRLTSDPYISFEDEYAKVRRLAEAGAKSFEDLVRFYWEITPDVPRAMADRFVRYALSGEERGRASLETIDADARSRWSGRVLLEVGCGTGGLLLAARHRFPIVVGADLALRWVYIAQRRLADQGSPATLVCCSADRLPFRDGTFDGIVAVHVLEHTNDPRTVVAETARTLRPGGLCFFSTPNRFSLGPEPCVRIWGVGFLPRALAARYVRLIKGVPYRNIRLLSRFELARMLASSGLGTWSIAPARLAAVEIQSLSPIARAAATLYQTLRTVPGIRQLLELVGPMLQAVGRK
jgi:2-polyprenyl-3-methyl-5-hydroxy-6-metoxy-1,4-benzoquinol methylase/uncharacterized protein YbaR (Trm112 family)